MPPEDIYEHPSEQFVAGFIGISNLLEGTVADDGQIRLANGQHVSVPLPDGCDRGDTVNLSVRPRRSRWPRRSRRGW